MVDLGNTGHIERSRFGDVAVVLFLVAQAMDGVLTYVGVTMLGTHMEANPFIAWLMGSVGSGAGLTGAKLVACGLGILLHLTSVHRVVASLAAFYLLVAVLPWMALLYL
jgi:hypothetical protein